MLTQCGIIKNKNDEKIKKNINKRLNEISHVKYLDTLADKI